MAKVHTGDHVFMVGGVEMLRIDKSGVRMGSPGSGLGDRIIDLATSTTLTRALHEGKTLRLTGTGAAFTQTLPAATGSGDRYRFVVGAVNTSNHLVKVVGNDIMVGNVWGNSLDDTPDLGQPWPTAADSDTITLNGTTTGGAKVGDMIELEDFAADTWRIVTGHITQSGTEATPFSAAVS
jgi:hypothetical protein